MERSFLKLNFCLKNKRIVQNTTNNDKRGHLMYTPNVGSSIYSSTLNNFSRGKINDFHVDVTM